jgi:hypothetical protein
MEVSNTLFGDVTSNDITNKAWCVNVELGASTQSPIERWTV